MSAPRRSTRSSRWRRDWRHGPRARLAAFANWYLSCRRPLGLQTQADGEHIEGFGHLLAKMAEEVWAWTEEPTHDAATGLAELEDQRDRSSRSAYLDLEATQSVELFAMAGQAALVGFALSSTMHYASDLELWIQQAMKLVGPRMMTPEARRAAKDATFTAYEEMERLEGRPVRTRLAN